MPGAHSYSFLDSSSYLLAILAAFSYGERLRRPRLSTMEYFERLLAALYLDYLLAALIYDGYGTTLRVCATLYDFDI